MSTIESNTMSDSDRSEHSTADERTDEESVVATITASANNLRRMISDASVSSGSEPLYDRLHLAVGGTDTDEAGVDLVGGLRSGGVMTYSTYTQWYFNSSSGTAEAVIEVENFLDYLDIASDGGEVSLLFKQDDEDARLAQQLEIRGKLTSSIMLPSGSSVLQYIPLSLTDRFDDDGHMLRESGEPLATEVHTSAADLEKIVDAVDLQAGESFYPLVVEDGEFLIEVGDPQTQLITGDLSGRVEGEDFASHFADEFEMIVDSLRGEVRIEHEPNQLASFVVDDGDHVTRTVMGVAQQR